MRIDKFLSQRYGSRTKAAKAVADGLVLVNGKVVDVSYEIKEGETLEFLRPRECYVSNGGFKLSKALSDFNFSVRGKIFADIGASTGGFTDCLLQNGAKKVYCIDVGESQLDPSLKGNNVIVIDNFNARNLTASMFDEPLDGAVIDVSFISLTYILGPVADILQDGVYVIALIKPQFECEKKSVGKNGIVKDPLLHKKIIKKIYDFSLSCNLTPLRLTNAPIKENKNKEYLILLEKNGAATVRLEDFFKCVKL